ncbi:MAG TPA: polysaccharide deacetylase family protein [Oligoflexia bacterium]|nr:polysaccharide deacetylase family protein [Oligoflexia bacterium]HMP47720.1 polysaccharide deacetylase family protein [Oligoflexia bacterium]
MISMNHRAFLKPFRLSGLSFYSKLRIIDYLRFPVFGRSRRVFLFHNIGNDTPFTKHLGVSTSREIFEEFIYLLSCHYRIIPFSRIVNPDNTEPLCSITFDDGLLSYCNLALPILEKYRLPSKIFINSEPLNGFIPWLNKLSYLFEYLPERINDIARSAIPSFKKSRKALINDFIDYFTLTDTVSVINREFFKLITEVDSNFDEKKVTSTLFLMPDQIRNLATNPLVEIGSHTKHHYPLTRLPKDIVRDEIISCHEELNEIIPGRVSGFAVPFGTTDSRTKEIAKEVSLVDQFFVSSIAGRIGNSEVGHLPEIPRYVFSAR